jgi:hypothetical protein
MSAGLGGEQTCSVAPERNDQRFDWRIKGKARRDPSSPIACYWN